MKSIPPLVLNGKVADAAEGRRFANALSDAKTLESTGGFLFKVGLYQGSLHIGILPAIMEGVRLHHYDVDVPDEHPLIGRVSAKGEFTLLFKTNPDELDDDERQFWRDRFIALAQVLQSLGYRGKGRLDWITGKIIEESRIFRFTPNTLSDIVAPPE